MEQSKEEKSEEIKIETRVPVNLSSPSECDDKLRFTELRFVNLTTKIADVLQIFGKENPIYLIYIPLFEELTIDDVQYLEENDLVTALYSREARINSKEEHSCNKSSELHAKICCRKLVNLYDKLRFGYGHSIYI